VTRHTRFTTALIASLAVVLAACGGNDDDVEPIAEPTPTETAAPTEEPPPDEPTETEEPEPDDPFAIPDEIDEAYVQSVLDELFAVRTEALRAAVESNGQPGIDERAVAAIGASHTGPLRLRVVEQVQNIQAADNVDEVFRAPSDMGQERFSLNGIYSATNECLVVYGLINSSEVNLSPPNESVYSVLAVTSTAEPANDGNPTPWLLHDEGSVLLDGEPAALEVVEGLDGDQVASLVEADCGAAS
jgi:hypothetical protein